MQYILFAVKPVQSVVKRWAPDADRTDYEHPAPPLSCALPRTVV